MNRIPYSRIENLTIEVINRCNNLGLNNSAFYLRQYLCLLVYVILERPGDEHTLNPINNDGQKLILMEVKKRLEILIFLEEVFYKDKGKIIDFLEYINSLEAIKGISSISQVEEALKKYFGYNGKSILKKEK